MNPQQIDRLKAATFMYRAMRGSRGKPLSLAQVVNNILDYGLAQKPKRVLDFEEEPLWKFLHNKTILKPGRLQTLKQFLVSEGFIVEPAFEALNEKNAEGIVLAHHLRNTTTNPDVPSIEGLYLSESSSSDRRIEIELIMDEGREFCWAREKVFGNDDSRKDLLPSRLIQNTNVETRQGIAFFSTLECLLHIFLKNVEEPNDRVLYVQRPASIPFSLNISGHKSAIFKDQLNMYRHGAGYEWRKADELEGSFITFHSNVAPRPKRGVVPLVDYVEEARKMMARAMDKRNDNE